MAWPINPRPAQSLVVLKEQLDKAYPGWLFLGMLGDANHRKLASDHNPYKGVVTALDIGPGGKLKIHELADRLASSPHPDLKYIISNRRIAEWQNGFKWRAYSGSDPHDTHIHISVGRGPDGYSRPPYDDRVKWNIGGDMTNKGDVINLFVHLLGREPDAKALKTWVGKPWGEVFKGIVHSPEYINRRARIQSALKGGSVQALKDKIINFVKGA